MEQIKIEEQIYKRNGTLVSYPLIVSGGSSQDRDKWNNIILGDINEILKLYSAYGFTQPTKETDLYLQDTLNISYEIKRNDGRILSIFYMADFYSPYAAHPTQLIYTTNIDLVNNKRLKLSDIIAVDRALVENFTSWELVTRGDESQEFLSALKDYIQGLGKDILLMGFQSADIIGPDNYLGIYSYQTPERIGISISVPNYLGDHVEYEKTA